MLCHLLTSTTSSFTGSGNRMDARRQKRKRAPGGALAFKGGAVNIPMRDSGHSQTAAVAQTPCLFFFGGTGAKGCRAETVPSEPNPRLRAPQPMPTCRGLRVSPLDVRWGHLVRVSPSPCINTLSILLHARVVVGFWVRGYCQEVICETIR